MRFVALDSWRGLCALAVVLFHFKSFSSALIVGPLPYGYLFVDFFFVLSGFVLAHAYGDAIRRPADIPVFLARRLGRIYPLHIALLAFFVAAEIIRLPSGQGLAPPDTFGTIVENILLLQAFDPVGYSSWNLSSWSLSVEFYAYLAFALTLLATSASSRAARLALRLSIAIVGFALAFALTSKNSLHGSEIAFPRGIFGFFIGASAFEIYRMAEPIARRLSPLAASAAEVGIAVFAFAFVAATGLNRFSFAAPVVFAAVTVTFAFEAGALSRALRAKPMQALGEWSFSIYMVHLLLLPPYAQLASGLLRGSWTNGALATVGYVALVVAASSQSYKWIERPCRSRVNRWIASRLRRAPPIRAAAVEA